VPILNRALKDISPPEVRMIREDWVQLRVEQGINIREVLLVAVPVAIAILIIFIAMGIWNRRLQREVEERQTAEERLRESEARLLDSQSIASVGSWVWNLEDDTVIWSRETYAILGVAPREYTPSAQSFIQFIHPDDRKLMTTAINEVLNGAKDDYDLEYRILGKNNEVRYAKSYGRVERDESGKPVQLAGVIHDISGQKKVELALREKQQTLQSLLDNAPIGIWFMGADGRLLFVNQAFCDATGISEAEFLAAEHYEELYDKETALACVASDRAAMASDGPHVSQEKMRFVDGELHDLEIVKSRISDENGNVVGLIGLSMDITARKQAEEKLLHQAYFDELTGLGNRNYLMEQLGRSLAQAGRHNHYNALLFFDLDNFKIINDSLGHQAGDVLLKEVGERLSRTIREEDTVARLGGDEFVLIVNDLGALQSEAAEQAHTVAEKVRKALAVPYRLGEQEHHITLSVGISMFPTEGNDVNDILKHADTAMYRAKEAGRNAIRFFIPSMQAAAEERLRMQNLLRYAIPHDQLRVHFQPQYDHEGTLLGAECLLRWKHPQLGVISPARFIPVAEDSGQIIDIGTWVLHESCKTLKRWQTKGKSDITLSVNVSPRQFHQPGFVKQVTGIIHETAIDPRFLELELTESILVEHIEDVTEKMQTLKELGVRFAIDDFGTGYSSLAYLKRLPLDRLKIDQSFIREVTTEPSDALIVETIIAMATHLELEVIAEGVETEAQLDFLFKRGCAMYQGYFFSRPLTREQFDVYLSHSHSHYSYLK
jgi:diguanylate cyclase (GGDEF)-like protein/PAS domain S-box-containing protein